MKYGEFLAGIEAHFTSDDIAAAIMAAMEEKIGTELPAAAKETIATWTRKSYELGLGQDWDNDKWKVTDQAALDFFNRHDQHFFGKQFEHYSDDMRRVVEDELKGISAYTPEVKRRMKEKLGDAFEHPYVKNYYNLCIRNAVNKSRNYGRTFNYERLGIAEIEIVAILDKKTFLICRTMNGRRIEVTMLADYVRETLETPMNELTEKFAWPTEADARDYAGMSTDDIMGKIKCKLPPFHGRCRTTTIIGKKTRVVSRGGTTLENIIQARSTDSFSDKVKKRIKTYNKQNYERINIYTKDELASKVNSCSSAGWHDEKKLLEHFETHKDEFKKFTNGKIIIRSLEEYKKISKKYLNSFDKVFIFGKNGKPRINFVNNADGVIVGVDPFENRITTCFPMKDIDRKNKELESKYLELK